MESKQCVKCKLVKDLDDFPRSSATGAKRTVCRDCYKALVKGTQYGKGITTKKGNSDDKV